MKSPSALLGSPESFSALAPFLELTNGTFMYLYESFEYIKRN